MAAVEPVPEPEPSPDPDQEASVAGPLGDRLRERRREINRLEAEFADDLAAFDRSGAWDNDGALTTQAWLRRWCHMSALGASGAVKSARRLVDDLPATRAALAAGDISPAHVQVIARGTDAVAEIHPELVARDEHVLADAARALDPGRLRHVVNHWRHAIEPVLVVADEQDAVTRRRLHLSQTLHGTFVLDGELDPEGGAAIKTALDALMRPDPVDTPRRSPARRRADALVELAHRQLRNGSLPSSAGERPHLSVAVSLETLEARTGTRGANLDGGIPISGDAARRLACDAGISRIVTDGTSQALDVGRRTPTVPPAMRRALIVRDRGCAWPGCDRPPEWTDAHHVVHWANGGETRLDNLALLCRAHHTKVHEYGWRAHLRADGLLEVKPP